MSLCHVKTVFYLHCLVSAHSETFKCTHLKCRYVSAATHAEDWFVGLGTVSVLQRAGCQLRFSFAFMESGEV